MIHEYGFMTVPYAAATASLTMAAFCIALQHLMIDCICSIFALHQNSIALGGGGGIF